MERVNIIIISIACVWGFEGHSRSRSRSSATSPQQLVKVNCRPVCTAKYTDHVTTPRESAVCQSVAR